MVQIATSIFNESALIKGNNCFFLFVYMDHPIWGAAIKNKSFEVQNRLNR